MDEKVSALPSAGALDGSEWLYMVQDSMSTKVAVTDLMTAVGFAPGDIKLSAAAAVPAGWLACDGSAVSRSTYAKLFTAISTSYGAGDGSTTFNLPNLLGRVPVGAGKGSGLSARALGNTGGEETHLLVSGELPALMNSVAVPIDTTSDYGAGWDNTSVLGGSDGSDNSLTLNFVGGGLGEVHNNMQPFSVVKYLIKT